MLYFIYNPPVVNQHIKKLYLKTEGEKETCYFLTISIPLGSINLLGIICITRLTSIHIPLICYFSIQQMNGNIILDTQAYIYNGIQLTYICIYTHAHFPMHVLNVVTHSQPRRAGRLKVWPVSVGTQCCKCFQPNSTFLDTEQRVFSDESFSHSSSLPFILFSEKHF